MRYEAVNPAIPTKWCEIHLVPGEGDDWIFLRTNGIIDTAKNEVKTDGPVTEFIGSFAEAQQAYNDEVEYLTQMKYEPIVVKKEE